MSDLLAHRGPDSAGEHLDGPVALAARRLSIVDVAHGDQPIANEDASCFVIQNGEIYNYPELRRELERQGHTFGTRCDTEAIVHLYEQHGLALRRAAARHVRSRRVGCATQTAGARARSLRDQAALLPPPGRRACVRIGVAVVAARRDRPRRARGVSRLQLDSGAVLHLSRDPQASRRPSPHVAGVRRRSHRALRASRAAPRRRAAPRGYGGARRGAAGPPAGLRLRAPARRRPRRRASLRRRRLGRARRVRRRGVA